MIYAAATIATGRVISTAPVAAAIRLDATGAFCLCGDSEFRRMGAHKVVLVILEFGILF
jgi:hypothetical protein